MIDFLRIAWSFRKWIGIGLAGVALAWAFLAYRHSLIAMGRVEVQAKWDADEADEARLAANQVAENKLNEAAAAARNAELERQHHEEIAAANAERDRVAGLLAQARRAARGGGAAQDRGIPGTAPAGEAPSAGPPDAEAELDGLIADALAESRANASQLNALIGEIKPQLKP